MESKDSALFLMISLNQNSGQMCAMWTGLQTQNDPWFCVTSVEGPWLPLQSTCFLPILWNLFYFKKALKILHLVVLFSHSHCNRTKWLEEYSIVLVPTSMVLAMSHHKFIFILYTMGYSLAETLLHQNFSWISHEWAEVFEQQSVFWGKHILSIFSWHIVSFLCRELMKSEMLLLIVTDAIRKNQWTDKSYGYGGYREKNCKALSSLFNSVNWVELRKKKKKKAPIE